MNRGVGTGLRINLEIAQEKVQRMKGLLISSMLRHSSDISKLRAIFNMKQQMRENRSEDNEALQDKIVQQ